MKSVAVRDIAAFVGQEVTLQGWLYNKRSSKKFHFLQLRDGSATIQCVVSKADVGEDLFQQVSEAKQEASLRVTGMVSEDSRSSLGYELHVTGVEVVGASENYPITPKPHGPHFLHEHRHLWLRSRRPYAILKIRARIVKAIRDLLDNDGYVNVDTPIFTPNACEGTSTLFETPYFGEKAYLTQSGQLYNEATVAAFGKVYCFGPTFRAEKSKTRRHLTEFWMVEPEIAFLKLEGLMDVLEWFVCGVVEAVLQDCGEELDLLDKTRPKDDDRGLLPRREALEKIKRPFQRLHYEEAVRILQENGSKIEWGSDLGGDDETILTKMYDTPVLVHHYPSAVKAFYMKKADDPTYSRSVDLLAPEGYGEVIGAGEREDDLEKLLSEIDRHGLDRKDFEWYLDLRRYGSFPHSGFGMGVERAVAWICGIRHVREAIPFPRTMERLTP